MIARLGKLDTWEETIVLGLTEQRLLKLVRSLEGTLAAMPLELLREILSGRIPTGTACGLIFLFWKPGKPRRAVMARRWLCGLLHLRILLSPSWQNFLAGNHVWLTRVLCGWIFRGV